MEGTATTTALHRFYPFFSISSHSNLSLCNKSPRTTTSFKSNNGFLSLRAVNSAVKDTRPNSNRSGDFGSWKKTQNLNSEVSPHRAVSAVRLLRIEQGGAFADLLNDEGKDSGQNEMGYVERTLGFRTRDLDDRDIRLVTNIVGGAIHWRCNLDHLILSFCNDEKMFRDMRPLLLQEKSRMGPTMVKFERDQGWATFVVDPHILVFLESLKSQQWKARFRISRSRKETSDLTLILRKLETASLRQY